MTESGDAGRIERPVISPADLQTIVTELAADGVWVAPSYAASHQITRADEQRLEEAVEGLERPVRVLLVEPSYDDPEYQGDVDMLVHAIRAEDDVASLYLVPSIGGQQPDVVNELDGRGDDSLAARVARERDPDDFVEQALTQIELSALSQQQVTEIYEREVPQSSAETSRYEEEGLNVWEVSGLIVGGLAVAMVAVSLWRRFVRGRAEYRPTSSLLRQAKGAQKRSRRAVAESQAVTLAQAVGRASSTSPATRVALAHLEAAQRALAARSHGARREADVVGALVLLDRGREALGGARSFAERCWFNPLHPTAQATVAWHDQQRSVTVPACRTCAAQVGRKAEPADILDLADGRATRHWFHLDLGPWSSTGFGAFSTDLPADLIRERAGDA